MVDAALLLVGLAWGYTFLVTKYLVQVMPVFWFIGTRFLAAGLIIGIWSAWRHPDQWQRPVWTKGVAAGLFLAAAYALQTNGIRLTSAGKAGMITELTTVMTPFFYMMVRRRPVARAALAGALLAMIGGIMMEWTGNELHVGLGTVLILLCDIAYCGHILLVDLTVGRIPLLPFVAVQLTTVGVVCTLAAVATESPHWTVTPYGVFGYLFDLVVGTLLAYLVQIFGQKLTNPTHVEILTAIEGPAAMIFAYLQWGDPITLFKGTGGAIMFGGVILTEWFAWRGRTDAVPVHDEAPAAADSGG